MATSMRVLAACAALAAAGCGDDSSTGGASFEPHRAFQATCNAATLSGICTTYVSGFDATALAAERSMCNASSWSTTAPCPEAGRLGRCTRRLGAQTFVDAYYGVTVVDLAISCMNVGGDFAPY
jgi:hypothetical protein